MKYKITNLYSAPPSRTVARSAKRRAFGALDGALLPISRHSALPDTPKEHGAPADISELFGFGGFYDPLADAQPVIYASPRLKKRNAARLRALIWRARKMIGKAKETIVSKRRLVRERRAARRDRAAPIPMLCGALCAVLLIFAVSLGTVGYRFLLRERILRFDRVTVPELVGQSFDDSLLDPSFFEVELIYEYDPSSECGTVIEQSLTPGVVRRVYRGGELCKISLTVSLGERMIVMKDYTSRPEREAVLDLKNQSLKFEITEKYSDTEDVGRIISTTPSAGESFSADEVVTLVVSLGKEQKLAAVPELVGLGEVRATELLRALGFEVGEIKYVASARPLGTVVSQSASAYSLLALGSRVDLSVSAGLAFGEKTVPNLYGLTPEEARERLAEVGLVCGRIYTIQSGGGAETVVSQSIAAGTPITAGVVSIDIYVSS